MPFDRAAQEEFEMNHLAPYAQRSAESRGRIHPEPPHPLRTEYQRDRDRIVHSRAFRRLEYKTQVFLNGAGDHLRTRLTHTIEVAAIARTIARALRLNEDLAETIALAHDLGHSPFGHAGERTLNRLMKNHGGFEHNRQSLRVVELLEQKYARHDGLNLTWETREGLCKHHTAYDHPKLEVRNPKSKIRNFLQPSLEAQIADLADEIAYHSHDLDDGLDAGLLQEHSLEKLAIWRDALKDIERENPRSVGSTERKHYLLIRYILSREVADVIATSETNIRASGVRNADEVRRLKKPLIRYSPLLARHNLALRRYLYKNLYFNSTVRAVHDRTCAMLDDLFHAYVKNPKLMGKQAQARIARDGLPRATCDYLAGFTDRYALLEWQRICGK